MQTYSKQKMTFYPPKYNSIHYDGQLKHNMQFSFKYQFQTERVKTKQKCREWENGVHIKTTLFVVSDLLMHAIIIYYFVLRLKYSLDTVIYTIKHIFKQIRVYSNCSLTSKNNIL